MKRFKTPVFAAGAVFVALFPAISGAADAFLGNLPNDGRFQPLSYPESIQSLIMADNTNPVQSMLTKECLAAVRGHIRNGGNFDSEIYKADIISVSQMEDENSRKLVFYHYSHAGEVLKSIASQKDFSELFLHARLSSPKETDWDFYVASDDKSSASYGPFQATIQMVPSTKVFSDGGNEGFYEILKNDPDLSACDMERDGTSNYYIIKRLSYESMGAGAETYFGSKNERCPPHGNCARGAQWLRITGSWAIQDMIVK